MADRPSKSVRWTGKDETRDTGGDYFSFPGGSANQHPEDSSSSSSSEDEGDLNVRATTRANTWFNQLRQGSEDPEETPFEPHPNAVNPPNPLSYVMDLGTHVSGGLAAGGAELNAHQQHDDLDDEYEQRRAQLLQSVGVNPTPPQQLTENENNFIPLQTMFNANKNEPEEEEEDGPMYFEIPRRPSQLKTPEIRVSDESTSSSNDSKTHLEAENLRLQLEQKQRERAQRMEEIIKSRSLREEKRKQKLENKQHKRTPSSASKSSQPSTTSSSASQSSNDDDDAKDREEEEELKRLEEAAKHEAEDEAKLLVMSHLNTNLLDPKSANDGYIDNNRYLLDSGMTDDDLDLEGDESEQQQGENGSDVKDESKESEKVRNGDDSSDSDDDSDDEHDKHITLRGDPDYVPPPKKVKEGVLGSLLRLYAQEDDDLDDKSIASTAPPSPSISASNTPLPSPGGTPPGDYELTPTHSGLHPSYGSSDDFSMQSSSKSSRRWKRPSYFRTHSTEDALGREKVGRPKWYKSPTSSRNNSLSEMASLAGGQTSNAASSFASSGLKLSNKLKGKVKSSSSLDPMAQEAKREMKKEEMMRHQREKEEKRKQKQAAQAAREHKKELKRARLAEQARITVHIADVLQRQRFLLRFGRALMLFGAPSHRLEEYLKITARVLEIDAQFLYMPGCMLVSFGDATTHTSETKLLRVTQGLNLNKLHATHLIYKEVVHDLMGLEEASSHIDHLLRSKNLYPWWLVVFFYGIACVCCGMFAYGAWWADMPIIFLLGGGVGFLQFWCQPKSDLYANVFEVSSSVVVSMLGRAFGSIREHNRQSDDTKNVFCFAAITQASLALILPGYIILVGALELQTKNLVAGSVRMFYANIYSLFLSFGMTLGSTIFGWIYNGATTQTTCRKTINPLWKILFVPAATLFMAVVNQAGPRQLPIMVFIGSAGFTVQYFVQRKVKNAASFTSAIGAFTMGVIGNLYSRVGHGLAFAAMLPGIFVLVPSGIAAQDSFVAGLQTASQIVNGSKSASQQSQQTATSINELGNSMTQVAVGIVVGLFAATLVVYPLGLTKKRSGLFTF